MQKLFSINFTYDWAKKQKEQNLMIHSELEIVEETQLT